MDSILNQGQYWVVGSEEEEEEEEGEEFRNIGSVASLRIPTKRSLWWPYAIVTDGRTQFL